jgi:hypothetical protein
VSRRSRPDPVSTTAAPTQPACPTTRRATPPALRARRRAALPTVRGHDTTRPIAGSSTVTENLADVVAGLGLAHHAVDVCLRDVVGPRSPDSVARGTRHPLWHRPRTLTGIHVSRSQAARDRKNQVLDPHDRLTDWGEHRLPERIKDPTRGGPASWSPSTRVKTSIRRSASESGSVVASQASNAVRVMTTQLTDA